MNMLLPVFLICMSQIPNSWSAVPERQLYEFLMSDYDNLERPVKNSSAPVTVTLGIFLQQLIDVDMKNQILTINAWLQFAWKDYKVAWNEKEFGGVNKVLFEVGKLWMPDVLLYNSVDDAFVSTYSSNLIAYPDGTVNWVPPGIFQISCKIDIQWFPFDEQRCHFKFGSWTYDGTKLDLQPDQIGLDMSEYIMNGEWNLYHTDVKRDEKFYECCPEPYPSLKFVMYMKRRTLFYGFNLIMPCILVTLMTILGFVLPPDAGEKIGLQITVLLSICFFLSIVSDMSPPTSESVPLLGKFFSTCMVVVSASVGVTVLVLNFHHRSPDMCVMGHFTRSVFVYWVPWIVRMERPGETITWAQLPNPFKETSLEESPSGSHIVSDAPITQLEDKASVQMADLDSEINDCFRSLVSGDSACLDTGHHTMLMMQQRIQAELKYITQRMADEDEAGERQNEWKFAAMAIDRLCLVVFTAFIVGSTFYIFWTAPYLTA